MLTNSTPLDTVPLPPDTPAVPAVSGDGLLPVVHTPPGTRRKRVARLKDAPKVTAVQEHSRWLFARHIDKLKAILEGKHKQTRRKRVLDRETGQLVLVEETTSESDPKVIVQALELLAAYGGIPKQGEVTVGVAQDDREMLEAFMSALREPRVRKLIEDRSPGLLTLDRPDTVVVEAEDIEVIAPQEDSPSSPSLT